jgi:hypothetical protein
MLFSCELFHTFSILVIYLQKIFLVNCFIEYSSDASSNLGICIELFLSVLFLTITEGAMYDHPRNNSNFFNALLSDHGGKRWEI